MEASFAILDFWCGCWELKSHDQTQHSTKHGFKKTGVKTKNLTKERTVYKKVPVTSPPFKKPHLMVGWIHIASRGDVISGSFTSGKSESLAPNLGQGTELRERERERCVFFGCKRTQIRRELRNFYDSMSLF